MRPRSPASASQATSRRAVPPLVLIAAVFFLPTFRRCDDLGFERPLDYVDGGSAFRIVPVFGGAALMALLTVRAFVRREVTSGTRRLALAGLMLVALADIGAGLVTAANENWAVALPGAAAVTAAAWVIRHGRGQPPWRIWEHLLCAFALLAAAAGPTAFLVYTATNSGVDDFGIGAYGYLLSIATLLLITSGAARSNRVRATR